MRRIVPGLNEMLLNAMFDSGINMVFNRRMTDSELIRHLGGPTKVAELLGYDKGAGGVQRVQNWIERGIPARVKLQHPDVFLTAVANAPAKQEQQAA